VNTFKANQTVVGDLKGDYLLVKNTTPILTTRATSKFYVDTALNKNQNTLTFLDNNNPAKDFCYGDRFVCLCDFCTVQNGVKWLVGPSSTSNRAASFFISVGHTGRCYGVLLSRADASDQRRARCWLQFFRKAGRNPSCHE
jgi:hypothetical protein